MWFGVVTIFPEMFKAISEYGITSKAIKKKLVTINTFNPRDYALDKYGTVDDRPYGGGAGMVMKVEPLLSAIQAANAASADLQPALVVLLSPQGERITQHTLRTVVSKYQKIIFICGRYEGVDERIFDLVPLAEWSVGDFILSGGELPAMAFIDALIRLVPGALGDPESLSIDSFGEDQLLDHPHYTRPKSIYNLSVPEVLLSGDHLAISKWRKDQRLIRTKLKRKDLLGG